MPSVPQLYDTQGKNRPRQGGGRALWTLFLGGVLALQLWSVGSLSSYALVLSDSYARHEELQTSLRDAELRLQSLQNATRDCESGQRDRADHAAAAERRLEVGLRRRRARGGGAVGSTVTSSPLVCRGAVLLAESE